MTRRTQVWLAGIALVVVLGTTILALARVGVMTGESVVRAPRASVSLDLPERGGRLVLDLATDTLLAPYVARHVAVERAGQRIIDTPLFPAPLDPRLGLALSWTPAQGREGPWLRLADPSGDILLDLRGFTAWRIVDHGGRAWLVAPTGVAAAGHVVDPAGALVPIQGRPFAGPAAEAEAVPLGRVVPEEGGLVFKAAAR
ncbi:hypothetical protein [Roseospira visakhapatnamensis]|uniref:Uncharacterized protein n=1 Tax=Roseospira visakhapatnamensis TaxID=390880 RepID=A0A7W6RFF2_9PROT|nr:hypothetical protein [Roseospira visakhapatnamensis]MBB4267375.1 hypothetical protein [Roseospira visakhapatnamensis]